MHDSLGQKIDALSDLAATEDAKLPTKEGELEVCSGGVAIDISGGCHAYLSNPTKKFSQIFQVMIFKTKVSSMSVIFCTYFFQPGFTGLWGTADHDPEGGDTNIYDNFSRAKLFCKKGNQMLPPKKSEFLQP